MIAAPAGTTGWHASTARRIGDTARPSVKYSVTRDDSSIEGSAEANVDSRLSCRPFRRGDRREAVDSEGARDGIRDEPGATEEDLLPARLCTREAGSEIEGSVGD